MPSTSRSSKKGSKKQQCDTHCKRQKVQVEAAAEEPAPSVHNPVVVQKIVVGGRNG
jgi:hypothetical protein